MGSWSYQCLPVLYVVSEYLHVLTASVPDLVDTHSLELCGLRHSCLLNWNGSHLIEWEWENQTIIVFDN